MALWEVKSSEIIPAIFREVVPAEILAEFEGPLTFTFRDESGLLLLAHLCAIGSDVSRYLVTKTNENVVEDLKNGMIPIRSAITRTPLWLVDVLSSGKVQKAWATAPDSIPKDVLPESDVLLTADLEEAQQADEKLLLFARSNSAGHVALDGPPVVDHEIDASFYGKFCQAASVLLAEICKAMELAPPILRLGANSKSSYAVDLKVIPPTEDPFASMFKSDAANVDEYKLRQAFERMISMMVVETPSPEIIRLVQVQTLRQKYGDLLELFSKNGATMSVRTRGQPSVRKAYSMQATERLKLVRDLGYPFMYRPIHGEFIGGIVEKAGRNDRSFLIRVIEGKNAIDYKGPVADEAVEKMRAIKFGQFVDAQLQMKVEDDKDQTFTLVDVIAVEKRLSS